MPRRRTSTALLEQSGAFTTHPERAKARANEPKPTKKLGEPPSHLTKEQRKVWKELVKIMPEGVAADADRWAVELLVILMTRLRAGIGRPTEISQINSLLSKFGLTPSDRSRVSITKPVQKDDPFAEFGTAQA